MNHINLEARDTMASMNHRFCGMTRLWHITTACVGIALMLALFLHATPAMAQQAEILTFEAIYIDQQTNEGVAQDCLRFSLADGLFRSDLFSDLGVPDGLWNAVGVAEGFVFSAFMNTIVADDTGQPVPFTISYGGLIDETVSTIEAALVLSSGARFALLGTVNPQCRVQSGARQQGSLQEFGK